MSPALICRCHFCRKAAGTRAAAFLAVALFLSLVLCVSLVLLAYRGRETIDPAAPFDQLILTALSLTALGCLATSILYVGFHMIVRLRGDAEAKRV